jgi:hypothetical protein
MPGAAGARAVRRHDAARPARPARGLRPRLAVGHRDAAACERRDLGVTRPQFEILPIDAVELDAVGLLPRSITGLPPKPLGRVRDGGTLARLFRAQPVSGLPAALSLTEMLALAELAPPADGSS